MIAAETQSIARCIRPSILAHLQMCLNEAKDRAGGNREMTLAICLTSALALASPDAKDDDVPRNDFSGNTEHVVRAHTELFFGAALGVGYATLAYSLCVPTRAPANVCTAY